MGYPGIVRSMTPLTTKSTVETVILAQASYQYNKCRSTIYKIKIGCFGFPSIHTLLSKTSSVDKWQ